MQYALHGLHWLHSLHILHGLHCIHTQYMVYVYMGYKDYMVYKVYLSRTPRVLKTCLYWPGDTWWTSDMRVRTVTRDTWLVAGAWPESLMSMSRDHQPITACVSLTNQPITTRGDTHVAETRIRNIILTGAEIQETRFHSLTHWSHAARLEQDLSNLTLL